MGTIKEKLADKCWNILQWADSILLHWRSKVNKWKDKLKQEQRTTNN